VTTNNLLDRVNREPAPGWKPNPGDAIIGTVVDLDSMTSDYGDPYPVVVIAGDDGTETSLHCFHSVLRREVAQKQVRPGDRLAVKYLGTHESRTGGKPYEAYRVAVEKSAQNIAVEAAAAAVAARTVATVTDEPDDGDPPF